ncbi:hypothetical protein B0H10DRAFT_1941616 [Mycena sp. CBHHK59/15]|nr:hypothetical protein B0H10DRAFT_1941616 [Mycena sp. CBHHK59/15]
MLRIFYLQALCLGSLALRSLSSTLSRVVADPVPSLPSNLANLRALAFHIRGNIGGNPIRVNPISPGVSPAFVHGTPAVFAHSNPVSALSNNVFAHQYKPVNAVLVEAPPLIQGPSFSHSVFGPMFPLSLSMGLDALFLSSDPLTNVLSGDINCLRAHLDVHGILSSGSSDSTAKQVLASHLLSVDAKLWAFNLFPSIT